MGKQNPILQGLAVAVILIIIGVKFAPSINEVRNLCPDFDCDGTGIPLISNHHIKMSRGYIVMFDIRK
jgi:hypothetical protein